MKKVAGFERHLRDNLGELGIYQYELRYEPDSVLRIHGYNQKQYKELAEKLKPDFNPVYSNADKGLIFKPVPNLFMSKIKIINKVMRETLFKRAGQSYRTLNDAAQNQPSLASGNTEIWYMNKSGWELFGSSFKHEPGKKIDLKKNYELLGKIRETDKEEIFKALNFWSPEGEANNMLRSKGLVHTSMSVGDIIKINNKYWMVVAFGFTDVTDDIV